MATTKTYSRLKPLSILGKLLGTIGGAIVVTIIGCVASVFTRNGPVFDSPKTLITVWMFIGIALVVGAIVFLFFQRFALNIQVDPDAKRVTLNYMTLLGTRHTAAMDMNSFDYTVTRNKPDDKTKTLTLSIKNNQKGLVSITDEEDSWPYATLEQIVSDFNELKSPTSPQPPPLPPPLPA